MSPVAAVIFDFDGVILDSETPEFESHRRVFERCGVELTAEEWCDQIGLWDEHGERRWHARLCALSTDAPGWDAFEAEKRREFHSLLPADPMRGIRELLHALDEVGVPAAIASTAPARWVVRASRRLGVFDLFQTIVTGDDVARRKPEPDVYLEAVRRLGVDPTRAVAVEDSGPGVAAARAAGLTTVAIPHWLTAQHDLSAADLRVAHAGELTIEVLEALMGNRSGDGPRHYIE